VGSLKRWWGCFVLSAKRRWGHFVLSAPALAFIATAAAVLVSSVTLYKTVLKGPEINMFPGERIAILYALEDQSLKVIIPCSFKNLGAKPGVVEKAALRVSDPGHPDRDFLLNWDVFELMERQSQHFQSSDIAAPFAVASHSSEFKYIRFHGAGAVRGWVPEPHPYAFSLVMWTEGDATPDLVLPFEVGFTEAERDTLRAEVAQKGGTYHWIQRAQWSGWQSGLLSEPERKQLDSAKRQH
jgi:hypothetical protein